jgi:hypothetical protein
VTEVQNTRNPAALFFTRILQAQGGGFARGTLRTYLAEALAGQLRGARGEIGRERYAEASQLALVLGRMYADDLRNGEAQHCYLTARELAITAGNRELTVIALRTLSAQAYGLGLLRIADETARAAVEAARNTPRAVRAFAQAQLAVTAASHGERGRRCVRSSWPRRAWAGLRRGGIRSSRMPARTSNSSGARP